MNNKYCLKSLQRIASSCFNLRQAKVQYSSCLQHRWTCAQAHPQIGAQSSLGHRGRSCTPTISRGNVLFTDKTRQWEQVLHPYFIVPVRQASSSTDFRDQEGSRISKAYLGDNLGISVQKHDGNRLIYEVRGQAMLRFVTLSFYATAAVGLYLAPDFISSALDNDVVNTETIVNLTAVGFAVVGLPTLLRMLSKRLVLKLYHNEARETYMAVTQSLLLTNKFTTFSLEDVVVKENKSILSKVFNLTTFKAKKDPMHVNPYNFKLPSDYNHLLGYDKDLHA
ncbi:transmembrane protein 70, mitochondrial-like [Lytechinus variegatus]|uniref:transmembrane protein 70, mitochondrial-like n=1 Tax=Lytechinus variegatus TaxID=7654 RepID=UPI001BB1105F|nr:transmembrane protein 70, mitochondrial-like [Lytechinus variegatus]